MLSTLISWCMTKMTNSKIPCSNFEIYQENSSFFIMLLHTWTFVLCFHDNSRKCHQYSSKTNNTIAKYTQHHKLYFCSNYSDSQRVWHQKRIGYVSFLVCVFNLCSGVLRYFCKGKNEKSWKCWWVFLV